MLKEVDEEKQAKFNKLIKIHGHKFLQKGEQISLRTLNEIYEDRLMAIKRASSLPEAMVKEAEAEWKKAQKELEDKATRQEGTSSSNRKSQHQTIGSTRSRQDESASIRRIQRHSRGKLIATSTNNDGS